MPSAPPRNAGWVAPARTSSTSCAAGVRARLPRRRGSNDEPVDVGRAQAAGISSPRSRSHFSCTDGLHGSRDPRLLRARDGLRRDEHADRPEIAHVACHRADRRTEVRGPATSCRRLVDLAGVRMTTPSSNGDGRWLRPPTPARLRRLTAHAEHHARVAGVAVLAAGLRLRGGSRLRSFASWWTADRVDTASRGRGWRSSTSDCQRRSRVRVRRLVPDVPARLAIAAGSASSPARSITEPRRPAAVCGADSWLRGARLARHRRATRSRTSRPDWLDRESRRRAPESRKARPSASSG